MIIPIILFLFFLCWGSFLNVVGYRLIRAESLLGRSYCVHCKHPIVWYDNIPVMSYLLLNGICRTCHQPISLLYPFIELFTAVSMILLYYLVDMEHFFAYFIFVSALIITMRTDLETMLISRWTTIALIPVGFLLSCADQIPINPVDSLVGAAVGYASLWIIGALFYVITRKEGIGEGDFELLAFIGAFTGIVGIWASLVFGSMLGSIIGITYLTYKGTLKRDAQLPFGPFLALGAIIYLLVQDHFFFFLSGRFN